MNPRELVDHIRSGPAEIVLGKPLRFDHQTCSNPCDFNEFLQALQSSETIRTVTCKSQLPLQLGITEDEWVLLVKTIGSIKGIEDLRLWCGSGSRDFRPFQVAADAVNNAQSLYRLHVVLYLGSFPTDPSEVIALANALREHTTLQEFSWFDPFSRQEAAPRDLSIDTVLRVLPACPHLRKVTIRTTSASAGAIKKLLQLPKDTQLFLDVKTDSWLAVTDEIRQGHCNVQMLALRILQGTIAEATEAFKAVASAIQMDRNLKRLNLNMDAGFTDAVGVALAEALTVNKTLRKIKLSVKNVHGSTSPNKAALGAPVYEALSAMLRVNTSLILKLTPLKTDETDVANERLIQSYNQMIIEQLLNRFGRGRLLTSSNHTTREDWVNALHELSIYPNNVNDAGAFQVSCLYSLLRLQPAICMLRVDDSSDSGE
jgi:hypothetical protein